MNLINKLSFFYIIIRILKNKYPESLGNVNSIK